MLPNILIDNINGFHSLSANRNINCFRQVVMVTMIIEWDSPEDCFIHILCLLVDMKNNMNSDQPFDIYVWPENSFKPQLSSEICAR